MQTAQLLEQLYNGKTLNKEESAVIFNAIMQGELNNEQIAAMLIALKVRGATIDELSGAVSASLQNAKSFPRPDYPFADIVGTGGDGQNTLNISTASAIVAASMGAKVAKHGNRSVSSKSGASDVLTALGVNVNVTPEQARQALDDIGVCFLFAQQYHSGFKHVAPVRAALKTRTLFNILGPLINPAPDAETLQKLSGIGEKKAQAIIDYRNKVGKIKNAAELSNIDGIGEATIEKITPFLSF